MSDQVSIIRNPLNTPEILANIFRYLPTGCLLKVTYVNKMWRLEARNKLYKCRSKIIYYRLLEPESYLLNQLRVIGSFDRYQIPVFKKKVIKISKFCNGFGLSLKSELFLIRDKLQERSNNEKAKYEEKNKAWLEAKKTFYANPGNMYNYAHCLKMDQELQEHILSVYSLYTLHSVIRNYKYTYVLYNIVRPSIFESSSFPSTVLP